MQLLYFNILRVQLLSNFKPFCSLPFFHIVYMTILYTYYIVPKRLVSLRLIETDVVLWTILLYTIIIYSFAHSLSLSLLLDAHNIFFVQYDAMPVSKSTVILYSSYFIKGPMFIGPCSSYNRLSRYYRCYIIIIIISIIVQYYFSSVVFEFVHIFTFNSNTRFSVVGIPDSYSNLLQHQRRVCELRVHAAPKTGD